MDIVYSLTCHEQPDAFIDCLRNILFFNKELKVCIVIHANNFMYNELSCKLKNSLFFLNDKKFNKTIYTMDIFRGHIENFGFCKENKIEFKYFIPLASNCYFRKPINMNYIDCLLNESLAVTSSPKVNWHWNKIFKNTHINDSLTKEGVVELFNSQHEGIILTNEHITKISEIAYKYDFFNNVACQLVFEEYLFTTLYALFTGKQAMHICKVFWELHDYTPSLLQVINCEAPCVKRVRRDANDPIRMYYNKETLNYSGINI